MIREKRNQHRRVGSDRRSPTNGGDVNSSVEMTVNYTFNEIEAP